MIYGPILEVNFNQSLFGGLLLEKDKVKHYFDFSASNGHQIRNNVDYKISV